MDPDEVLRLFRQALAEGRWRDAAEHADTLDGWLTAGGFPPAAWPKWRVTDRMARIMAMLNPENFKIGRGETIGHHRQAAAEYVRRQTVDGGS